MSKATLYKPCKNVMQSGIGNTKEWVLAFSSYTDEQKSILMGWVSSFHTEEQLKISFPSKEAALLFAESHNVQVDEIIDETPKREKKSYPYNFTKNRKLYYY